MQPLSRQQVRSVDSYAIERLNLGGLVLMENAGRGCVDVLEGHLGGLRGRRVGIVAGGGNNGGDGFVMARHLAIRGAAPVVFLTSPPERLTGDAAANYEVLVRLGLHVETVGAGDVAGLGRRLAGFDFLVDAVGGTGIRGALSGAARGIVEQINAADRPVLAVDIPTGLDCDSGKADGPAVRAAITATMVAPKLGFSNPDSRAFTGEVRVVDIGLPGEAVLRALAAGDQPPT